MYAATKNEKKKTDIQQQSKQRSYSALLAEWRK
jgi:hypothetical protein